MRSGINHRLMLRRPLGVAIVLSLIVTMAALIYGHLGGQASGLSLIDSYVTEYMKRGPHWPWLIVASFALALLQSLLAFAFILRAAGSPLVVLGCLLLAATSMANFFVAYSPIRRVEQPPPPAHQWWTPTWWFTSQTSRTLYEHGMADAYSDVHYRATRLAVVTGVAAIFLLALGFVKVPHARRFAWLSLGTAIAITVFFLMGDHLLARRGLWQRLGFAIMYGWYWFAYWTCLRSSHAGNSRQHD